MIENVIEAIVMTCPRCGKQIIRKKLEEKVLDGGFTRTAEYEPVPDEWKYIKDYDKFFCSACFNEYKRRLDGFLN